LSQIMAIRQSCVLVFARVSSVKVQATEAALDCPALLAVTARSVREAIDSSSLTLRVIKSKLSQHAVWPSLGKFAGCIECSGAGLPIPPEVSSRKQACAWRRIDMILWIVKLMNTARRAIAGRKYPHQLAWAVAFGLLLGIVPHGNLLALILLVVVLSLKINHAMAGLTAVAATFVATQLDPISHQIGDFVLTQPKIHEAAVTAWALPLVPWTDLNNTVVMGSFLIGVGALVPVFVITYPVFRFFRPLIDDEEVAAKKERTAKQLVETPAESTDDAHRVVMVDHGHSQVSKPHTKSPANPTAADSIDIKPVAETNQASEPRVAVETRIDVIRMQDNRESASQPAVQTSDAKTDHQPMDEALNYLLRQLRDSQQRKAA
jgi:uncharacterized protein (TIGR03546 family)